MGSSAPGLFAPKGHSHGDKSSTPGHRVRPWGRCRARGSSLPEGRWGSIGHSSSCASAASRNIFNTLKHIPPIFYLWQMNVESLSRDVAALCCAGGSADAGGEEGDKLTEPQSSAEPGRDVPKPLPEGSHLSKPCPSGRASQCHPIYPAQHHSISKVPFASLSGLFSSSDNSPHGQSVTSALGNCLS